MTERVYNKIWRHRGSEDEARDESLRSKIMALSVVNVGLKELGVDKDLQKEDLEEVMKGKPKKCRNHTYISIDG